MSYLSTLFLIVGAAQAQTSALLERIQSQELASIDASARSLTLSSAKATLRVVLEGLEQMERSIGVDKTSKLFVKHVVDHFSKVSSAAAERVDALDDRTARDLLLQLKEMLQNTGNQESMRAFRQLAMQSQLSAKETLKAWLAHASKTRIERALWKSLADQSGSTSTLMRSYIAELDARYDDFDFDMRIPFVGIRWWFHAAKHECYLADWPLMTLALSIVMVPFTGAVDLLLLPFQGAYWLGVGVVEIFKADPNSKRRQAELDEIRSEYERRLHLLREEYEKKFKELENARRVLLSPVDQELSK